MKNLITEAQYEKILLKELSNRGLGSFGLYSSKL